MFLKMYENCVKKKKLIGFAKSEFPVRESNPDPGLERAIS
jgi:hypothetical protein